MRSLDGLAGSAVLEARFAALKVRLTADYAAATRAMASPTASPQDRTVQEMAMIAELACVLTVSEHAAGALLGQSQALTTALPLTLDALQAGTISWAHARIMVDETGDLDPAGAAALEAHFLDPGAPNPARGCPAGELVPGRFRAKSRTWRERHHPVSIEKRHTKCAADRRVEFTPDRDGMAWLSAYLPAVTAAGIWDRMTAAARALQGPDEARTLTQLRADVAASLLLATLRRDRRADRQRHARQRQSAACAGRCGGCGEVPVPRAQVLITVPVLSLLGATEEPAMLDGYGPIPPSMARALVADGAESFHRVLTDPRDGAPLEIGRASYRLTKGHAPMAPAPRRPVPLPGLQQPVPGQRRRPPPGLGRRRHHRDHQPRPALPQTPRPQTRLRLDTRRGHQRQTTRLDLTLRTDTTPANTRTGNHPTGHPTSWPPTKAQDERPTAPGPRAGIPTWTCPGPRSGSRHGPAPDPGRDPDLELPPDPFPDWHHFPAGHEFPADRTPEDPARGHRHRRIGIKAVSVAEAFVAAFLAAQR